MINSDYIIFHLFEIYYHVLDKFSSNSPSWIIFEKYIEILADIVINISAMTF